MKEITLKHGNKAIVDDDMFDLLNQYKWRFDSKGYAYWDHYNKVDKQAYRWFMHHSVVGKPLGSLQIDYINRNKLDNRRINLRIVTPSQNSLNR